MATRTRRGVSTGPHGKHFYNVRDLLGHWNKRPAKPDQMCPHACCQGKRVHPKNFPVILPKKLLREASDKELADHYAKYSDNGNASRQILAEMARRDRSTVAAERARDRRRDRRHDYIAESVRIREAAEEATHGHMVNELGRRRGITPADLWRMPEERAAKYASRELLDHWQKNPRTVRSTRRQRDASRLTDYRGHHTSIYRDIY